MITFWWCLAVSVAFFSNREISSDQNMALKLKLCIRMWSCRTIVKLCCWWEFNPKSSQATLFEHYWLGGGTFFHAARERRLNIKGQWKKAFEVWNPERGRGLERPCWGWGWGGQVLKIVPLFFQIREDWKFVAMVVDRLQLYVFFIVTTVGTIGILMDAPHIFEYVDQDKIIDIYRGK